LGGEGNLWTERIPPARLYYMAFPRITALSEALWTEKKDYENFYRRLQNHYVKLDEMGVNYGPEGDVMDIEASIGADSYFEVKVSPKAEGVNFEYYFEEDKEDKKKYSKAISFKKSTTIYVQAYRNGKTYGEPQSLSFTDHKARMAQLEDKNPTSKTYSANENSLIDGLRGSTNFRDGKWKGYNGVDMEAVLTFSTPEEASKVSVSALSTVSSWIFLPTMVEVYISADGENYTKAGEVKNLEEYQGASDRLEEFVIGFEKQKVKSIKVKAVNYGTLPQWHSGRGYPAYLFIDEIIVN